MPDLHSESALKTISNNFTDGMIYQIVFEPNGTKKFTYLSNSVKQLYGISSEEGMENADLIYSRIHDDDISSVLAAEEQSLKTLTTFKTEVRIKDPSGAIRWSSYVSTPRVLEDGSVCFDGIEFIITKAKQIEEILRENEERFRELSSVTQEGIMVHEGGIILDANQSFAELIGYSNPDDLIGKNGFDIIPFTPESRKLIIFHINSGSGELVEIEIVRSDGSLMPAETLGKDINYRGRKARVVSMRDITSRKKLISDLIEAKDKAESASKLKDGEYPITKKEVSVSSICLNLIKVYSLAAQNKSLNLTFLNNCGDGTIFADEYSITLAISNLIDNAIKYTAKGFINVELRKGKNEDIILDISDTGIGISEDYLDKIFEPYHQEQMGYGRAYEGVGLGLSLVKQVLSLNNVKIFVESTKGEGTTFSINFGPEVKQIEHLSSDSVKTNVPPKEIGIKLILLVEDDGLNQMTIKRFIEPRYRSIIVDSSEDALEILKTNNIDLILMDISIKGKMDGLEFTRMLKNSNEYSKIPVIAVTAHAFEKDRQASLEAGCDSYLSKPFSRGSLLGLIDNYSIKLRS
jgi:PAS domain S-box-containing protein